MTSKRVWESVFGNIWVRYVSVNGAFLCCLSSISYLRSPHKSAFFFFNPKSLLVCFLFPFFLSTSLKLSPSVVMWERYTVERKWKRPPPNDSRSEQHPLGDEQDVFGGCRSYRIWLRLSVPSWQLILLQQVFNLLFCIFIADTDPGHRLHILDATDKDKATGRRETEGV